MWILIARGPAPDVPYWAGRRWLAAIDALGWPVAWLLLISNAPGPMGVVGLVATGITVCSMLGRLHRALWVNHRYRFATWRWGRVVVAVLAMGLALKLIAPA